MSDWTKERLERMIADGVEESLSLDYKRGEALSRKEPKRVEITKDVSAFANSAGGVLIYGVAEPADKTKRHLPERLDPIRRADVSKEWLEQIIQTIQPHIEGVVVHPVTIDEHAGLVCYVVEVPASQTAHQARDHVYYKRHNFNTLPMEDYEVRDVMSRRTLPRIRASMFVDKRLGRPEPKGTLLVKLENVGKVLVRRYMVEVELPIDMNGLIAPEDNATPLHSDEGEYYLVRLRQDLRQTPIFPGSYVTLKQSILTVVDSQRTEGRRVCSTRHITVSVYADEMQPIKTTLDFAPVIMGWTAIEQSPASLP